MPSMLFQFWKSYPLSSLLLKFFLLITFTIFAHFPVDSPEALIDDKEFYIDDPVMEASDGLKQIWFHPLENDTWPYIPLTRSSFWLERQGWGLDLRVSHWINLILHLLTALCLWLGLQQLRLKGAWLIGMLFALHPVHVQSVAWIVERKNMVAGFFYVLTLWCYCLFVKKKLGPWYGIALFFFLCALLSKTSTIMLPFVLIICHFWLNSKLERLDWVRLLPFFLCSLGIGLLRIWFESRSFETSEALAPYALPFLERVLLAGHIPFFYLNKLLFPYPLIFTYPRWEIDSQQLSLYLPALSIVLIAILLFFKYQTWGHALLLGLGVFLISLFPVLGFINTGWLRFSFVSDHWVHLPSLPILILIVQASFWVGKAFRFKIKRHDSWFNATWSLLFLFLGFLTWKQTRIYQNETTLWSTTLVKNPVSWIAYHHLGNVYLDQGKLQAALELFDKEIQYNTKFPEAYANRGVVYFRLQQYDQALENLNQAILLKPNFARFYRDRGLIYFHLKAFPQMCADWKHACHLGNCRNYHLARKKRDCP